MTDEIREFANAREAGAFSEFCEWVTELYEIEMPRFIDANFDSPLDLAKRWRAVLDLIRHGGFGSLDSKVAGFFEDERLRQVFSFQAMYAGLAPREALALYSVITYMDTIAGVFAPRGGVHAVASGLARAVADAGATIRYDTEVSRILRNGEGWSPVSIWAVTTGSLPTPLFATPTCRWHTERCWVASTRPEWPVGVAIRPRVCCGSPGCVEPHLRVLRTTTSISDTSSMTPSRR